MLAELARGRLRTAAAAAPGAAGRFSDHHALLVRLALEHLEHLEGTIAALDRRVDEVIAPFARARDQLATITGVGKRAAETIIAEIGVDMTVPHRRAPGFLGGALSGQQPHRWQTPLRQDHQGQPLAGEVLIEVLGRCPQPRHLPIGLGTAALPDASARRRRPWPWVTRSW